MYPKKLPTDIKPVWFYEDCFPKNRPFKLVSTFCHKNYNMFMHSHNFYEINYVINGMGVHYTEKNNREAKIGDVFVIPPEEFHGYYNVNNLDVFHMLIHKNFFHRYYSDLNLLSAFPMLFSIEHNLRKDNANIPSFHIFESDKVELDILFKKLDALEQSTVIDGTDTADYLKTYTLALLIIIELCSLYKKQFLNNNIDKKNQEDKYFTDIFNSIEFIHLNYKEKINLDDITNISFMSKTAISNRFKEFLGMTPLNYVNYYRVLASKKLLLETEKSITEIAIEVGFYDCSHFIRNYEKYEGTSPSELRKILIR
jgi:AraC family L-rhamnose operon transcriptional activator RhaR/AraC family L-rhamnose operon regulatory protein RhaS